MTKLGTNDMTKPAVQAAWVQDGLQPAIDVYVVLMRTADAVARHVESELNKWGITTAQYGVLLNLMRRQPISLTELSGLVFRSHSTMTSLIDRMEREELVTRGADAGDRRVTTVELTAKGRELFQEVRAHYRPFLAEMMSCLSPEELAQLSDLLAEIQSNVTHPHPSPTLPSP